MAKYRYMGYGTTDSNGIAKLDHDAQGQAVTHSYTGTGVGEVDIVASLDEEIVEGSIVSEIFVIDDCYWIEQSSTIEGMYITNGATLTLDNGLFNLKKDASSSYFYLNIPRTSLPIADFKGKTMTVKTDVTSLTGSQFRVTLFYHDGSSWSASVTKDIYSTGLLEQSIEISSNATQVRIRYDIMGNTGNDVDFKDFRILLT